MTIHPLPIQLSLNENESFLSFIGRVAEANYLRSMRGMHIALGLKGKGILPKLNSATARLSEIANALGIRPEELAAILPQALSADGSEISIHGLNLKDHHILRNVRRVSPAGLREQSFHRFPWQLFDLPFCTQHWEMLIEECPSPECRHTLSWSAPQSPHICESCGFDLRFADTQKIEETDRRHLQFFADLVSADPLDHQRAILPLAPNLRQLNRGELIQLAILFGRVDATLKGDPIASEHKYLLACPTMQTRGADIVRRYPQSLNELLDNDIEGVTPRLITKLKAMYPSSLTAAPKAFIKDMITDLSSGRQPGIRGLAARRKEIGALTARNVASLFGIDNAAVRRLVKAGHLKSTHIKGDARKLDWFSQEDVDVLAATLRDKITPDEVVSKYGLPLHAIEQLVQIGVLRWHPSPALTECFLGQYLMRSEVETFIDQLNCVSHKDGGDNTRICLSEVFAATGPTPKPWAPILEMARVGALKGGLWQIDPKAGFASKNLTVDVTLLANVLQGLVPWGPQNEPTRHYCTQLEVEERLSIFPRDTSTLIKAGVLLQVLRGSTKISRASMLEVAAEYISSAEIAARVGIEPRKVAKWIRHRALEKDPAIPLLPRRLVEPFLPPRPKSFLRSPTNMTGASLDVVELQSADASCAIESTSPCSPNKGNELSEAPKEGPVSAKQFPAAENCARMFG